MAPDTLPLFTLRAEAISDVWQAGCLRTYSRTRAVKDDVSSVFAAAFFFLALAVGVLRFAGAAFAGGLASGGVGCAAAAWPFRAASMAASSPSSAARLSS